MHHYATKLVVGVVLCLVPSLMAQSVVYVDDDAPAGGDGTSWNTAYRYLQDALAKARSAPTTYPEIHIAAGTHCPDRSETGQAAAGDRNATFSLVSGVAVRGGYAGRGVTNPDARDVDAYTTTLSGDLASNDNVEPSATENSYHVVTGADLAATTLLEGVTITAGNANGGSGKMCGAGLTLSDSLVSVVHVSFLHNIASSSGGGADVTGSTSQPTFTDCRFGYNSARFGGGMYFGSDNYLALLRCTFEGNSAQTSGGGVDTHYASNLLISACRFYGNQAGTYGGGCCLHKSTVRNCIFADNTCDQWGGALYAEMSRGPARVLNSTVVGNTAAEGGGLYIECDCYESDGSVRNCILRDNLGGQLYGGPEVMSVSHSCIQGGWEGTGNIDADPLFVNAAERDFRLQSGSPCIDAGNNSVMPVDVLTDVAGNARFADDPNAPDCRWAAGTCGTAPIVDMGAYEVGVTISGRITYNDAGVQGVTLAGVPGSPATDANGYYSVGVSSGWTGTLAPTKAGYTFTPATRSYSNLTANQTGQDYSVTGAMLSISGRVTFDGLAQAGVAMEGLPGSPETDVNGNYGVEVPSGWAGTVTPVKKGHTFDPAGRSYGDVTSLQSGQDYTSALQVLTITGRVTMSGTDTALSGVRVSGGDIVSAGTTDTAGVYAVEVNYGWSGTLTASKGGYAFSPSSRTYAGLEESQVDQDFTGSPVSYAISGRITLGGAGLSGVTMSGLPGSPQTDADGNYSGMVSYRWSGTVRPTKAGYVFTPVNRQYSYVYANQQDQNYEARLLTFPIKGQVLFDGSGLAGVAISGLPGNPVTDADGNYSVEVEPGWSGTATPIKSGYKFSPVSRSYANVSWSCLSEGYTASVPYYKISGYVKTADGVGVSGVRVSGFLKVTETNADGLYYSHVPYGWSGTGTPSKEGYTFAPVSRSYPFVTADQAAEDFEATQQYKVISGRVMLGGNALAGVVLSGLPGNPETDETGRYSATLAYGWAGTVTPIKAGYRFSPTKRSYTKLVIDCPNEDYTATAITYTISGTVLSAGYGLSGVILSGFPQPVETNTAGTYSATVPYGWSGTVTPTKNGCVFEPSNRAYANTLGSQTRQDFVGTMLTYTVSGRVTCGGEGLSGVVMSGLPGEPQTDGDGNYSCTVNYGWSGTVKPTKAAYAFTPSTRTYTSVLTVQASQDYVGEYLTISGRVTVEGKGLAGVVLSGLPGNPATDADGRYTATVNSGWSGTVTPTLTGYTFSPPSITYAAISAGQADQNYEASHLPVWVSGFVRTAAGTAVAGASITTTNGGGSAVTATTGQYSVSVPYLWSGRIQASKGGYTMVPESRELTSVSSNTYYQNFEARVNIAWYRDADNDGYGTTDDIMMAGVQPAGYVADGSDCNDGNGDAHPGGVEVCGNGVDEDCDGQDAACSRWYRDADGDGYGDAAQAVDALTQPEGYVADARDCDDTRKAVHVGATEVCGNSIDDDCDKQVDESCAATSIWYRDADKDGFGNAGISLQAVEQPSGYVADGSDCHDGKASIHPGATEVCGDGVDQDCDGQDAVCDTVDADGDGVPDASDLCSQTPASREVDANGCAASQRDSDGDTVADDVDACADTVAGTAVDATGCPVSSSTFTLRVQVTDGATAPAPAVYDGGITVAVYAPDAAEGYHFDHWSGDASGSDNPISMVMDADKSLTANYAQDSEDQSTGPACASGALAGGVGIAVGLLLLQTAASVVLRKWCLFRFRCLWHRRLACACTGGTPVPQEKMQTA
jgi:hypothetical protein